MLGDRGIRGRIVAGIALVIVVVDAVHSFLWAGGDRTWIVLCGLSVLALVGLILARDRRWPKRHTTALFGTFLILGTASVLLPPSAYADAGWWLAAVSRLIPATVIGLCFLNVHPEEPAIRYGVPACALLLGRRGAGEQPRSHLRRGPHLDARASDLVVDREVPHRVVGVPGVGSRGTDLETQRPFQRSCGDHRRGHRRRSVVRELRFAEVRPGRQRGRCSLSPTSADRVGAG
jgi:hypothetical protein